MDKFKLYAVSTLLTFVTAFALVVVPDIDSLTPESFKDGTIAGLLFATARLGIKMILENYLKRAVKLHD